MFEIGVDVADEAAHLVLNGHQVAVDLRRLSFDQQLNTAVGEVAHESDKDETARQPAAGRSKPDAVNPAREKNAPSF